MPFLQGCVEILLNVCIYSRKCLLLARSKLHISLYLINYLSQIFYYANLPEFLVFVAVVIGS